MNLERKIITSAFLVDLKRGVYLVKRKIDKTYETPSYILPEKEIDENNLVELRRVAVEKLRDVYGEDFVLYRNRKFLGGKFKDTNNKEIRYYTFATILKSGTPRVTNKEYLTIRLFKHTDLFKHQRRFSEETDLFIPEVFRFLNNQ